MLNVVKYWILAFRPKTLTAAVVPIVAASAFLYSQYQMFDVRIFVVTLLCALFIQIATNLFNDAIDFKKGADTADRIGPTRVTAAGLIPIQYVWFAAGLFLLLAFVLGSWLVAQGGWTILVIGMISLFLAYSYTGGPFPLAYLGLGDLFVILFFGVIAVMGYGFLQLKQFTTELFVLGLQVGLLCAVLIAVNNLRDVDTDKLVGKKTIPVRFGKQVARYEIAGLIIAPLLLNFYWWGRGLSMVPLMTLMVLPLAGFIIHFVFTNEPSKAFNGLLAKSALLHLSFGVLASVGFLLC
jgi:1,4-dihydroxy-2-naphthoate octaprenyltransferase